MFREINKKDVLFNIVAGEGQVIAIDPDPEAEEGFRVVNVAKQIEELLGKEGRRFLLDGDFYEFTMMENGEASVNQNEETAEDNSQGDETPDPQQTEEAAQETGWVSEWAKKATDETDGTEQQASSEEKMAAGDADETKMPEESKRTGRRRRPIDAGEVIALKNAGWSVKTIAEELGVTEQTVYNHLKKIQD
ncbi:MAG: helix-turn-helix domain-containing protein [Eubacteriales bacterium]|nr:helix-turn-helix domain-containing protein [Eubacteriales bacterium]